MRLQTEYLVERYQENIFRAAFSIVKNCADAEDMVQDTFLQFPCQRFPLKIRWIIADRCRIILTAKIPACRPPLLLRGLFGKGNLRRADTVREMP